MSNKKENLLESKFIINNEIVNKREEALGAYDIYETENSTGGDEVTLYFVNRKTSVVEMEIKVSAEMSQGFGYISDIQISSGRG